METFSLFGDLRLEDPVICLKEERQMELAKLMPLIEALESRNEDLQQNHWNMEKSFRRFQERESALWNSHNIERSIDFMVRPAGCLKARVACHLYNPTFSTADPNGGIIEDTSYCSIMQVINSGFSSENCLLFDHLARRDLSHYCDRFYPPDIRELHESFMLEIRDHMEAKVEICWGVRVQKRMQQILKLRSFPLWGHRYKDVQLFMEMTDDETALKRFVLFVRHPASFFYFSSSPHAQEKQTRIARQQDQLLSVAASLGRIQIPLHFYENSPLVFKKPFLTQAQVEHKGTLEAQAREQLIAVAGTEASLFFWKEGHGRVPIDTDSETEGTNMSTINPLANSGDQEDKDLRAMRQEAITTLRERISNTFALFTGHHPQPQIDQNTANHLLDEIESSDMTDIDGWDEVPRVLAGLLEDQDGLKIRQRAISSREDLERVYHLLHCQGNSNDLSIIGLSFTVLMAYLIKIARPRKRKIDCLIVLRESPFNIVSRKCHYCGHDVLDDVFPWYAKRNPELYVYWRAFKTCGNHGCQKKVVRLIPTNPRVKTLHPSEKNLTEKLFAEAKWEKHFIRPGAELAELPKEIKLRCIGDCGSTTTNALPRWTVHEPAKLVETRQICRICKKMSTWLPLSEEIKTIADSSLQRLWAKFQKQSCDLADYPRRPDIWFANHRIPTRIRLLKGAKRSLMTGQGNELLTKI